MNGEGHSDVRETLRAVGHALAARRLRERTFGDGVLNEPSWTMLLELFAAELEDRRLSVSGVCVAADVPATTGLRLLAELQRAGMVGRHPDPNDGRRAFFRLTQEARSSMMLYWRTLGPPLSAVVDSADGSDAR